MSALSSVVTPVTITRIGATLSKLNQDYLLDTSTNILVVQTDTGTVYIDIVDQVMRVRSIWNGWCSAKQMHKAISLVLRWNRETAGPKAVLHQGDPARLSTQTNQHISCGLDDYQLQAGIMLAMILASRFFMALAQDLETENDTPVDSPHLMLLRPQHIASVRTPFSNNFNVEGMDSKRLRNACQRLHLPARNHYSHLDIGSSLMPLHIRLFGENTWLSISSSWNSEVPAWRMSQLFDMVNYINEHHAFGVVSILGSQEFTEIRVDHIVNVGDGMSDRQLDTQIVLGTTTCAGILKALDRCILPTV